MSPGKGTSGTVGGLHPAAASGGLFGWRRHAPQVATALALGMALLALLVALNLLQLTAPGPAHRALRRAVASLTEIDSLLAVHDAALRQQAGVSPDEPLSLPDYPLDVSLSPEEAQRPAAEVRDLLLDRSAEQVYQEGSAAFREEGQSGDASRLSVQGAVDTGLGFLTAGNHDALRWATLVLAVVSGVLSGALILVTRGYGRLRALGGAVAAGITALPTAGGGCAPRPWSRWLGNGRLHHRPASGPGEGGSVVADPQRPRLQRAGAGAPGAGRAGVAAEPVGSAGAASGEAEELTNRALDGPGPPVYIVGGPVGPNPAGIAQLVEHLLPKHPGPSADRQTPNIEPEQPQLSAVRGP